MGYAKKIGWGAALVYGQNILSAIFGILTAIIVIRSLGVFEYGVLTLAMATMGLLIPFLDFGIGQVVTADIASEIGAGRMDKVKRLYWGYVKTTIVIGIVLSAGLFIGSFFVGEFYGRSFPMLLRLASGLLLINPFRGMMLAGFGGFSRFKALSAIQASESIFKFGFIALMVLYFKLGSVGAMSAYLLATVFSVIFIGLPMLIRVLRHFKGVTPAAEPMFKNLLLGHGKFQIFSQPLKSLYENARAWIITILAGVEALAIFQVAFQVYSYAYLFLGAIEAVLLPIFSEEFSRSIETAKRILVRTTKYAFWLSMAASIMILVFIPPFFKLLFGDKYAASIPLILFTAVVLPLDGLGIGLRPALFSLKAQKALFKMMAITLAIIIPTAAILTKFYGAWGFILILPLASAITLYLRYGYLKKYEPALSFRPPFTFSWDPYDRELFARIWNKVFHRN